MTVVLDTEVVPERLRLEALHSAYQDEYPRRHVIVEGPSVRHRVERLTLAPQVQLLRTHGSPLHILRTMRQVKGDAPEHVAIGLRRNGRGLVSVADTARDLPVGELNCVDMTQPYRLMHQTDHAHDVLILSNEAAGVSVDLVRAAATTLQRSPLYGLVRGHVAGLFASARPLSPALQLLTGQASTALVRALLTTAAASTGAQEALEDALAPRLALYFEAHLSDPDLTVARAAVAHHISVRHLYKVWADAGHASTPAQWVLGRRLEQARHHLVAIAPTASIVAVAHRCGFSDPSHFSRRFREAFGTTPSEWRAANTQLET